MYLFFCLNIASLIDLQYCLMFTIRNKTNLDLFFNSKINICFPLFFKVCWQSCQGLFSGKTKSRLQNKKKVFKNSSLSVVMLIERISLIFLCRRQSLKHPDLKKIERKHYCNRFFHILYLALVMFFEAFYNDLHIKLKIV